MCAKGFPFSAAYTASDIQIIKETYTGKSVKFEDNLTDFPV